MYKISIKDLEFDAIIGVLDFERVKKQLVRVNCDIWYEDKNNYIDYSKVVEDIKSVIIDGKFLLIEDALDSLIEHISLNFPHAHSVNLSISKPEIIDDCEVLVTKLKKKLKFL